MSEDKIVFWANKGCPYVQRAWWALLEKKLDFEWKNIELQDEKGVPLLERKKEMYPELYKLNPHGKVPVIEHKGHHLYESLVVAEYIDEVFTQEPKLMPQDAYQRGLARIWISNVGDISAFPLFQAVEEKDLAPLKKSLTDKLTNLNNAMEQISKDGPYFLGKDLSMVDIAFLPHFDRLVILLRHYRNYEVPKELTRLWNWYNTTKNRPAYQQTCTENWEEYLIKVMKTYVK